ncbi:hypothetical protein Ancab_018999 [Ancistrocladus abbreviatus]
MDDTVYNNCMFYWGSFPHSAFCSIDMKPNAQNGSGGGFEDIMLITSDPTWGDQLGFQLSWGPIFSAALTLGRKANCLQVGLLLV